MGVMILSEQFDDPDADSSDDLPPAEAWEQFELHFRSYVLSPPRMQLNDVLLDLEAMIEDGHRPTAEQIHEARDALDQIRALVEDVYAPVATGDVEPWDDGVGGMVPLGVLARQLDRAGHERAVADGGIESKPTNESEDT